MKRRHFISGTAALGSSLALGNTSALPKWTDSVKRQDGKIINAYYFRAHCYTMVPHQVREDLQWMADVGTNTVSVGVLEQDLYAAVENLDIICNEAAKLGMSVMAVPSRWGGLVAGAPKVPSVFTCQNPETWIRNKEGAVIKNRISGCISSIHHPDTYAFMEETSLKMLETWPFSGIIWDEPKSLGIEYSEAAKKAMNGKPSREGQLAGNVRFYSKLNRAIKKAFPKVSTHFFVHANTGQTAVDALAKIDQLDYFGCDGRPWYNVDGGKQESKGKVLLGEGGGNRFIEAAKRNGKKGLWLIENHNMAEADTDLLAKRLLQVISESPEHLIYYYFPRNLAKPYEVMSIFKEELKKV